MVGRIDMGSDQICITFQTKGLFSKLGADSLAGQTTEDLCVTAPLQVKRRGIETKLIIANERSRTHSPDPILIRLIAQAHCWFEELKTGRSRSNRDLAQRHRVDPGDVARVLPLAFLAPDIVAAIVDGSQPVEWTTTRLKRLHDLPHSWEEQRRLLEFG